MGRPNTNPEEANLHTVEKEEPTPTKKNEKKNEKKKEKNKKREK